MKPAYLDTSYLLAILFDEPQSRLLERKLERFHPVVSSPLLEAETRSALLREEMELKSINSIFTGIHWVIPDRPLTQEINVALEAGYLRGADLWHLASALFVFPSPKEAAFLTLDASQRERATALGFK